MTKTKYTVLNAIAILFEILLSRLNPYYFLGNIIIYSIFLVVTYSAFIMNEKISDEDASNYLMLTAFISALVNSVCAYTCSTYLNKSILIYLVIILTVMAVLITSMAIILIKKCISTLKSFHISVILEHTSLYMMLVIAMQVVIEFSYENNKFTLIYSLAYIAGIILLDLFNKSRKASNKFTLQIFYGTTQVLNVVIICLLNLVLGYFSMTNNGVIHGSRNRTNMDYILLVLVLPLITICICNLKNYFMTSKRSLKIIEEQKYINNKLNHTV